MPKWGRDRIRRFYDDASTRKRMAAHDYEAYLVVSFMDILVCPLTSSVGHHAGD